MKIISCFLLCLFLALGPACVWAQSTDKVSYPSPTDYVVDQAGIISDSDHQKLDNWITELQQKTAAQVAVVTVNTTQPLTIEDYAVHLFERFGIGQKGKDNGVLLLVAYKDHHMRIEVGYGLEGAVTDAYSSAIIRNIITPEFKAGNFSNGITKGTAAILSLVAKEYHVTLTGVPAPTYGSSRQGSNGLWFIVLLLIWGGSWFMRPGLGLLGAGMWYGGGFGGRGGFGGGGFGGGFGGFGGGISGGGGASGGW